MATKTGTKAKSGSGKSGGALVKWDEKFAAYAKQSKEQVQSIGVSGVSVRFGHGTISVGDKEIKGGKLECVIVGSCAHNRWFKKAYNAKETSAPDCYAFAVAADDPDMAPHAQAPDKQSPKCAECPKNVFGTATQGKGKACGNTIRLGVVVAADLEDGPAAAAAEMATAGVSPTNLKRYKKYVDMLDEDLGRPPWAVVTEIACYDDKENQIRVEFKLVDKIEDDDVLAALEKRFLAVQPALQQPYSAAGAEDKKKTGAGPSTGKSAKFAGGAKGKR